MAPPSKFKGARLQFFMDNLDGYADANANGGGGKFLSDLIEKFARRFSVSVDGVEVEPSKEELQNVNDTKELEEVEAPVKMPEMSEEVYVEVKAAYKNHECERNTLAAQICNFMNYRNHNRLTPSTKAHRIVLDKLAGLGGAGRCKMVFKLWAKSEEGKKIYAGELEKRLKEAKQEPSMFFSPTPPSINLSDTILYSTVKNSNPSSGKKDEAAPQEGTRHEDRKKTAKAMAYVILCQEVIKSEFGKLPEAEKWKWHNAVETEFKTRKDMYDALVEVAYSKDPEACQQAIEDLPTWAIPFLEGITRMNVSLFAGRSVPADGGNIHVMGIHCGSTSESNLKTFGVIYKANLQKFFVLMFGNFCCKTFTKKDCEAASLGSERRGGPIFGLDSEEVAEYWKLYNKAQAKKVKTDTKVPSQHPQASSSSKSSVTKASHQHRAALSLLKAPSQHPPPNVMPAMSALSKRGPSEASSHLPSAKSNPLSSSLASIPPPRPSKCEHPSQPSNPTAASSNANSKWFACPLPTGGQLSSSSAGGNA
ncbi:hypothetical protein V5O48_010209 [Marasmius crinis-equi]|uniref:Uncharacterized protein n=1 Tax=Marasmius crinis-equi TaxID=585013 RepID=A0ABR3F910_9AGAR